MKKAICLVLTVITLISSIPFWAIAEERPFPDVPADAWYTEYFEFEVKYNNIKGNEKGEMMPTKPMTRAEAVTYLYNHRIKPVNNFDEVTEIPFTDVKKSDWFYDAVKWAYCSNVTLGTGNNRFSPNDYITREDYIVMMYKYYSFDVSVSSPEFIGGSTSPGRPAEFKDKNEVSDYALKAVNFFTGSFFAYHIQEGYLIYPALVAGYNGYLMPKKACTRAEALKIYRAMWGYECPIRFLYNDMPIPQAHIPALGGIYNSERYT